MTKLIKLGQAKRYLYLVFFGLFFAFILSLISPSEAHAATLYWVGADKETDFHMVPILKLTNGTYRLTLTGKDNTGNITSSISTLIIGGVTSKLSTTPVKNKGIIDKIKDSIDVNPVKTIEDAISKQTVNSSNTISDIFNGTKNLFKNIFSKFGF